MAISPPQFADVQHDIIAAIQNNLVITDQLGNRISPNFSNGSVLLTFSEVLALVMDAFYGQMVAVDAALRLATAAGDDLDALGALVGATRGTGAFAQVPVKFSRNIITGSAITIPTGITVYARDFLGNATIAYTTIQDPAQALGVAGVVASGATAGWAMARAVVAGLTGNVGAGQVAQLGSTLAGIDSVSNPQVQPVQVPVITQHGTAGSTTRQFGLVAHGLSGMTAIVVGQTTTGHATPNGSNYDIITWQLSTDATGYDVLLNTGSPSVPVWALLTNVASTVTTLNYTGQATTTYAAPTSNTSNTGAGGVNPEPDDGNPGYRQRIPTVGTTNAKSTDAAIEAAVLAVPGVTRVFGADGTAGTFHLYYVGAVNPVASDTAAAIVAAYTASKAAGIQVVAAQVTLTPVSVAYTFAALPGYTASSLIPAVNTAITNYFTSLALGAPVRWSQVATAITSVPGVSAVNTLTLAGGSANTDVAGSPTVLYGVGTLTATVGS